MKFWLEVLIYGAIGEPDHHVFLAVARGKCIQRSTTEVFPSLPWQQREGMNALNHCKYSECERQMEVTSFSSCRSTTLYKVHQEFVGNFDLSSFTSRGAHDAPVCSSGSGKNSSLQKQRWCQTDVSTESVSVLHSSHVFMGNKWRFQKKLDLWHFYSLYLTPW